MAVPPHPLISALIPALSAAAVPAKAPGMQAYMKSAMPYRGVAMPDLRRIVRGVAATHPVTIVSEWRRVALQLWRQADFREDRYAAIELLKAPAHARYRVRSCIPMVEEMIVTGAWWDYVDPLASDVLGDVLVGEPKAVSALMRTWSTDAHLWKRRAAILCQLRRKRETDLKLLYTCIEPNLGDRDFFIRKAIGWALRQYAWTDPREIARYVKANRSRLSPLSTREALKNI